MAKPKPKHRRRPTKDEFNYAIAMKRIEMWAKIIPLLIRWLGYCFIAVMVFFSIRVLAGKVTIADIKFIAEGIYECDGISTTTVISAILFGISGIMFGLRQRKLRCDTIERLHPYQLKWEKHMDNNRTSSTLTKRGDTRPEDV